MRTSNLPPVTCTSNCSAMMRNTVDCYNHCLIYGASMAKESAQKGYLYIAEQPLDHLKPFPNCTSFSRVYRLTLKTGKKDHV